MKKPIYFYDETLKENFWFFLGWKPKACEEYLSRHWKFDTLYLNGAGKTIEFQGDDGKTSIAIWTKEKPKDPNTIGVLCHECVHAAHFLLKRRGVVADFNNDEVEAYLTERLMRVGLGYKEAKQG